MNVGIGTVAAQRSEYLYRIFGTVSFAVHTPRSRFGAELNIPGKCGIPRTERWTPVLSRRGREWWPGSPRRSRMSPRPTWSGSGCRRSRFFWNFQAMVKSLGLLDNNTVFVLLWIFQWNPNTQVYLNVKNNLPMERLPDEHTPQPLLLIHRSVLCRFDQN